MTQKSFVQVFANGGCDYLQVPVATARFDSDKSADSYAIEWCLSDKLTTGNMLKVCIMESGGVHGVNAEIYDTSGVSLWQHPTIPFSPTKDNIKIGGVPDHKFGHSEFQDTIGLYVGPNFDPINQRISIPWYTIRPVVSGIVQQAIIAFGANINAPTRLFAGATDLSLQFTGIEGDAQFDPSFTVYHAGLGETAGVSGAVTISASLGKSPCVTSLTNDTSNCVQQVIKVNAHEVEFRTTASQQPIFVSGHP